jgi:Leucine-rich repeat (LRR) protein
MRRIRQSGYVFIFAGILLVLVGSITKPSTAFGQNNTNPYNLRRQQKSGEDGQEQTRVVHFPMDRSMGQLLVQDANSTRELTYWFHWTENGEKPREYLCQAQGEVNVPAGKRLCLEISLKAVDDLSALERLGPEDLYRIECPYMPPGQGPASYKLMQHITHLTGLKYLSLRKGSVSDADLQHIKNLRSLEYLDLPDRITDAGLVHVAGLPSLKGLYIGCMGGSGKSRVTDRGLLHISRISSLEELYLRGEYMSDKGLEHLIKLSRLKYLALYGSGFTNAGCVHIKEMSSLKILSFHQNLCRISDAGLVHIGQMPRLEFLCLHAIKNITDAGIVHLTKMPSLKKLEIGDSQVTDKGLEYLSQIITLERLDLPQDQKGITDRGLEHLSRLPNLKHLGISRIHFNDPKMNKEYYTDKGLEFLAHCQKLEYLRVGSIGVTDAGMEHLAKLTNLKTLNLFGCDNITDGGLAKLSTLKHLENLNISCNGITIAGINQLNSLSNIRRMHITKLQRGDATLDLSGMKLLEDVIITLRPRSNEVFTDADLACFKHLEKVTSLQLGPRSYTDSGMRYLAGLTEMKRLLIGGAQLTDTGIRHLAAMEKLELLDVSSTEEDSKLTDETLSFLERFKCLNFVNITSDVPFSPAAVQRLERALPSLFHARIQPTGPQPQINRVRPQTSPSRRRR